MHVGLIIGSERIGGYENQMRLLARGLLAAGYKVTIIFTDHPHCRLQRNPSARLDFSGIPNIKLCIRRGYKYFYYPFGTMLMRLKKIDLLIACDPANAYAGSILASSQCKLITRISGLIFTLPGYEWEKALLTSAVAMSDAVISNAQVALDTVRDLGLLPPDKYQCVIRNAVNIADCSVNTVAGRFHVLYVGRLQPVKDPVTLLKALETAKQHLPELTAEFVGDGALFGEMKQYIEKQNLSGFIKLTGFCPQEKIPYEQADLVVNSSISELSSGAIAEALCRGIPVVATDVGGNPELLAGYEFGALVPPQDPDAMAQKIVYFARKTPEERRILGQQAQAYARQNFSLENYVKNYIRLISHVAAR